MYREGAGLYQTQAARMDVVKDANRVPVVDDAVATDFTGPAVEVEWKNYQEVKVKMENAGESDAGCSAVENADRVDDSCVTHALDFTDAYTELKQENCPTVKVEPVDEYSEISLKVRVLSPSFYSMACNMVMLLLGYLTRIIVYFFLGCYLILCY